MKTKTIRPKKARSQGEILPHIDRLTEYSNFEDYHTKRSNGTDTKFKDTTVKTINLNGNWIDVGISITSMTGVTDTEKWTALKAGTIVVHLYKEADNSPLANEKIDITIRGELNTVTTNANGFASVSYEPTHTGVHNYIIEYNGNSKKGYKPCDPLNGSFTVKKLGVTITQPDITQKVGTTFNIRPLVKDEFNRNVEGLLEWHYGDNYIIDEQALVNGSCLFTRTFTSPQEHTYWLHYEGNSLIDSANKNFTLTCIAWDALIKTRTSNYEVLQGETLEFHVAVVDELDGTTPVDGGSVQISENNIAISSKQLNSEGKTPTPFQYNDTGLGNHDIKIDYIGTNKYGDTSKTVHVNVFRYNTFLTLPTATNNSFTTKADESISIRVNTYYRDQDNEAFPNIIGVVKLYEGNTLIGTKNLDDSTTNYVTFDYTPGTVGTHNLEARYIECPGYAASTKAFTVEATKKTSNIALTLNSIYDYPGGGSFVVKVTNNSGAVINEGTLTLEFIEQESNITKTVGTYNLASKTGNFTVARKDLLLDELYTAISSPDSNNNASKLLYYTGYKVKATYDGSSNYLTKTVTNQPMNLKVHNSQIVPYVVINDDPDYRITNAVPSVPSTASAYLNFRIDHENEVLTCIQNNRPSGTGAVAYCGTVKQGQTIFVVTDYRALRIPDSQRTTTENNLDVTYTNMGGLTTDVHYRINDGQELDTTNAQINSAKTTYELPRYVKFTIPNTVQVGDHVQLIFNVGYNLGFYHFNDTTDVGLSYCLEWEVVQ